MADKDDLTKRAAEIGDAVKRSDDQRAADGQMTELMSKMLTAVESLSDRLDKLEAVKDDTPKAEAPADDKKVPDFVAADRADLERRNALGAAQAAADAVANHRGERAPPPLSGEDVMAYRRRLLRDWRSASKDFSKVDLWAIPEGPVFDGIEKTIFADAKAAADNIIAPEGQLVPRITQDPSGRQIVSYYGQPKSWMSQFSGYKGSVKSFSPPTAS